MEYEALGEDFRTRGARQEEQIDVLRRLFTEPVVDFWAASTGSTARPSSPKPTRSIPIWLGGASEAAYERAARLADGFIFIGGDIAHTVERWQRLRQRVRDVGRPVDDFGAEYVVRPQGGVETLRAQVEAWREAGGTHVLVVTMGLGLDSARAHVEYLATVADALRR